MINLSCTISLSTLVQTAVLSFVSFVLLNDDISRKVYIASLTRLTNGYGGLLEWYWMGETDVPGENPVSVPPYLPQIPQGFTWDWTRALALTGLSHGTAPIWQTSVWSYDSATDNRDSRFSWLPVRGGTDKFLARPGRKQATATKLGIYSTCSPRRSIQSLVRCSNFCKPPKKKKIQNVARPTRSLRQQLSRRRKKNGDVSNVFFSPGNRL